MEREGKRGRERVREGVRERKQEGVRERKREGERDDLVEERRGCNQGREAEEGAAVCDG